MDSTVRDSTQGESSGSTLKKVLIWPFSHIVQPIFNLAVYPIAQPLHYAFDNGIIEKSVDFITFGEKRNILIYPAMNLKPGSSTMLGVDYRHRSMLFERDYLVLEPYFYSNGDWYLGFRYSKQGFGNVPLYAAFRAQKYLNRDGFFVVPGTKDSYVQPDSSLYLNGRLGFPLTKSHLWNMTLSGSVNFMDASLPDNVKDSILIDDDFSIESRGLYQDYIEIPLSATIVFDNLDYSYAPSKGTRFSIGGGYAFVKDYSGLKYEYRDENDKRVTHHYKDDGRNHDYVFSDLVLQHYIYIGKTKSFHLTNGEARKSRRFYLDFSWDEALRTWHPDKVMTTLFERRVLAFQFRMNDVWEIERGEAPYSAFPWLNGRYPLRGYDKSWAANHIMGFSMEYRWPVDKFVDGVVFDEYAMYASKFDDWSMDRFYNSWGFGVRVRQPNMYLFRIQFGFHGLHGVNLVLTISPEFK